MSDRRPEWMAVARWEIMRTVGRVDFLISVLLMPVFMIGMGLLVGWFKQRALNRQHPIAVVRHLPAGGLAGDSLPAFKGFQWAAPAPADLDREALVRAVTAKRFDGAVLLPADPARDAAVELIVRRSSPGWKRRLERHVHAELRRERATALGLDRAALDSLDAPLRLTEVVTVPAGKVSLTDKVAGALLVLLLIVSLFMSTSYMAIGITGEKQARVTEVIVSAIRPQSWIDGKIVAYSLIGFAQALLWVGSFALAPLFFPIPPPTGLHLGMLLASTALFVLGMVLYVSLFALILATIKDLQSTAKLQAYLYFLPFTPFIFLEAILANPDATWGVLISQVPFFSPFLLPARMAVGGVAPWEIASALVLLVIAAYLVRRAAGVAFRVAMLMYGKELSLPELARWAKQA